MLSDALEVPAPTLPYSGHEEEGERHITSRKAQGDRGRW